MKTNPDGTPKTSVPRGVARLIIHNSRNLANQAKRKIKGER